MNDPFRINTKRRAGSQRFGHGAEFFVRRLV